MDEIEDHVSIPSRRVGDRRRMRHGCMSSSKFPSPQGGSETCKREWRTNARRLVSIPSRRVGDRYRISCKSANCLVSIPSRRVGDKAQSPHPTRRRPCFHPLKAGRRHGVFGILLSAMNMFPSPQGGSETRQHCGRQICYGYFPSPQGGSETQRHRSWASRQIHFPSPQGGSETVA